ncbi:unnamed protein product [Mortierella alpina]
MNQDISPFCLTSDGMHIYAAAYSYDQKTQLTANIIVVRSNSYPSSLDTLTWSLMAEASTPSFEPSLNPNTLVHTCAIRPKTALFGISAQAINGSVSLGTTGFNMQIPLTLPTIPVASSSKLPSGHSLLLPRDDTESPWLRIHLTQRDNEMILVSLDTWVKERPDPPHWNITGTGGGLLAHLDNTLYILQSTGTGPLLSTITLDPSTAPTSAMPSVSQTTNTGLEEDCDFNSDHTVMATDKRALYLLCRERPQSGLSGLQMFKMYMLNGTVFQQSATIPAETQQTIQKQGGQPEPNASFHMVPVPNPNGSASWIYFYHPNGHAYSVDPIGDNLEFMTKNTTIRVTQHYSEYSWPSEERRNAMGDPWVKAFLYLALAGIMVLLCLCAIRHHKQRPKQPRRLNPQNHPLPSQLQPTLVPDSVPATYRVPTGEDACDSLPHYAPRNTDAPFQMLPRLPMYTEPPPKYMEPPSSSASMSDVVPPPSAVSAVEGMTGTSGSVRES